MTSQIEPEWDDATRSQAEALARYLAEVCECGFHKSVIDNWGNRHFTFEERFCPACAAVARYGRVVSYRDDAATPKNREGQPAWPTCGNPNHAPECRCTKRPDDGRHIFVRELTPAEVKERAKG